MLRHGVNELHLDHASDFLSLVPQDQLRDLLITHIGRPVNFRAKVFDFCDTFRLGSLDGSIFNQSQIGAYVLEHSKARSARCPMPRDFHWLVLQRNHRLRQHDCSLLTSESIKRFVTVWLLLGSLRIEGLQL